MRHAHRDSLRGQNPGFPAGKLQLYGPWTVVEGLLLLVNTQAHSSQNIPRLSDLGHLWTLLQVQLHSNDQLKLSQAKIPRSGCCANQANVNWHGYNKSFSFFSRGVSGGFKLKPPEKWWTSSDWIIIVSSQLARGNYFSHVGHVPHHQPVQEMCGYCLKRSIRIVIWIGCIPPKMASEGSQWIQPTHSGLYLSSEKTSTNQTEVRNFQHFSIWYTAKKTFI